MSATDGLLCIIFFIFFGVLVYIELNMFFDAVIYDSDERYSKRIAKHINKGNLYKAVRLYKKHNPAYFFTKYVKEHAADNFNNFVHILYTYIKSENSTANVVIQSNLFDFIASVTDIDAWALYREDENFHAYFQEKIDIMKNSDDVLDNKKWQAEDSDISICLFILALKNTGFLKIKDEKKIDFKSLVAHRWNGHDQLYHKEFYNIMDDCEAKDIITKVLNYNK